MIIDTDTIDRGKLFPGKINSHKIYGNNILFNTDNNVIMNLTVVSDTLIRFRYTAKGYFSDDFSYAIDDNQNIGYNKMTINELESHFELITDSVVCHIQKENCKITIYDVKEKLILDDEIGFHWIENQEYGGNVVIVTKKTQSGECFFGLGDKSSHLNLKGKRCVNWVTDQYAYHKDQDPLYKAIPFYVGLHSETAYGIFFDNSFKTQFDFSSERNDVTSFWADGGEMNYYYIHGPKILDVIKTYTNLTGKPEIPPMWALGYHQSKWSYDSEKIVKDLSKKFRDLKIPCDAIHLDIDYMDGFRCFTWNNEKFPNPKKMIKELGDDGYKIISIIDPGIKIDNKYEIFNEGIKNDYFCKRADGPIMKGKVWPGECAFPDFTNPEVREWWSSLFKELISEVGIKGVWNDMNEPAVMEIPGKTFPNDVRHHYDGHPCSHRKAHNIYGMQMAKASYLGLKKFMYPKRPFLITRAAYSGTQRYSSTWTGDNIATWEHLWIANMQIQRLSLSGYSFCGSDIGGFAEQPQGDLYARWIQMAVFHPLFRTHSSGQHGDQEPWSFGKNITEIVKKTIEFRYQLLPYLYTAFCWEYVEQSIPIIKSLVVFDQTDPQTHYRTDEFIFGSHILVCPIDTPNALGRMVYLPKGNWYDYNTHQLTTGKEEIWVETGLENIPIFVLEGAIIPKYPIQQYVGEIDFKEIELEVFYKSGKEQSYLYEDAHDGYDYTNGKYLTRTFNLNGNDNHLVIYQNKYGSYKPRYDSFVVKFIGLPFEIQTIKIDKEIIPLDKNIRIDHNTFRISDNFQELVLYS